MAFADVLADFGILLTIALATGLVLGIVVWGVLHQVIERMRQRRPLLLGAPLDLLVSLGEALLRRGGLAAGGSGALAVLGLALAGATGQSSWTLLSAPLLMLLVLFGLACAEYLAFRHAHLSSAEEKEWNRLYRWG